MDLCNVKNIKELLERNGFHFSKALGQNFLIESWVPTRIAEESGIDKNCGVLEIGPGIGCLTSRLAETAAKVVSVELDKRLLPVLSESLREYDNIEIVSNDILKINIPQLIREKFAGLEACACANLPYNITTPVLSALIDSKAFKSITVMVQLEVAKRICSEPGTPDYGAFTVYANYYTTPEILFEVQSGCFMPRPKVSSAVIKLKTRLSPAAEVCNEQLFFRVVRGSFAQRRKTLANGLSAAFSPLLSKAEITEIISECGFNNNIRGETLGIKEFAALTNKIGERLK